MSSGTDRIPFCPSEQYDNIMGGLPLGPFVPDMMSLNEDDLAEPQGGLAGKVWLSDSRTPLQPCSSSVGFRMSCNPFMTSRDDFDWQKESLSLHGNADYWIRT